MHINTKRFGTLEIESDDILLFSAGLVGFEECRHWVLLADQANEAVAWLQCITHADVGVPVTSPRRFLDSYVVRVSPSQLETLRLDESDATFVLTIISRNGEHLTANLKAPLLVNLTRRVGRQVVVNDDQPLQHVLAPLPASSLHADSPAVLQLPDYPHSLRKSA